MTATNRRGLLAGLAALPVLAACEAPRPAPRPVSAAAPSGPLEPAPVPSDITDDYLAQRRAATTAAPTGPDAMPGFGPAERIGTDQTTAPIPGGGPRLFGPR